MSAKAVRPGPAFERDDIVLEIVPNETDKKAQKAVTYVFNIQDGQVEVEAGHVKITIVNGEVSAQAKKIKEVVITDGKVKKKEDDEDSDTEGEDISPEAAPSRCCKLSMLLAYAVPTFTLAAFKYDILSSYFAKLMGTVAKTSLRPVSRKYTIIILGAAMAAGGVIDQFNPYSFSVFTTAGVVTLTVYERFNKLYILGKKKS